MRIKIKPKRRWLAMGTLAAYAGAGAGQKALAQSSGGATAGKPKIGLVVIKFEIAPGRLEDVITGFMATTRVNVALKGFGSLQSPGVTGLYTPDEALKKLLSGTGLVAHFQSSTEAFLAIEDAKFSVNVSGDGSAIGTSMPKYNASLTETPQTITVVSPETMSEQGVTTLRDALRNVAGISLAAGEGGAQGDSLTIRGFTARNDLFIDGMRDFGSYYRDPFNTEEVEVLQGPSSVTFGRGSTGGAVNQASKTPLLTPSIAGTITTGTDLTRRLTLDINQPLNDTSAFRLNLMGNENDIAGRDIAENRRFGIAPSLAFGLGTATRWTFSYMHQTADDTPDYGIPWLFNQPAPVNRHNYYGFKDGNFLRTYDDIGTAKVEHDFNKYFTLRDQIRYANYVRAVQITEPQVLNASLSTPLSQLQINRNEINVRSIETNLDEQLDLISHFQTGFLKHTVTTGVEAGRETSDPVRATYTNVPSTSLLDPDENQVFSGTATPSTNVHTTARTIAAYILDTIEIGKHWDLTGGVRFDRFGTDYTQSVAPASAFSRVDRMPSWRSALVYKPAQAGSFYVAAGTSFNPSAETLSLSASNANLPPERNITYEAGTKWDFVHRLSLRSAVFDTTKLNAREPDPDNSLLNVLAGNQRVRGTEFEVRGHLTSRWDVLSGYAYLDGKVISSNYYPASVGAQLANVPKNTFNFWTEYRLTRFLSEIGAGTNFVDSRTASSTVPLDPITGLVKQVPSYWVFNAMAKRRLTEHISLQVNLNNIANRYYYDQVHPGHIVPGVGRSALIGLQFEF